MKKFCVILLLPITFLGNAQIIDQMTFERGDDSEAQAAESCGKQGNCTPCTSCNAGNALTVVDDIVGAGSYAGKARVPRCYERSEWRMNTNASEGSTYWYGWSVYLPNDFTSEGWYTILTQIKQRQASSCVGGADHTMTVNSANRLRFDIREDVATDLGHIDEFKGKWAHFVLQITYRSNSTGSYQLWVKSGEEAYELKADRSGVRTAACSGAIYYFKYGIYTGDPCKPGPDLKTVYVDSYRMGNSSATFDDVRPDQGGEPVPENPEPKPPCDGDNLAAGGSIHSASGAQEGNPASNLIDGVSDTDANRWSSLGYPQWVIVDLGSSQSVQAVKLQAIQQRNYSYQVYASESLAEVQNKAASALVVETTDQAAASFVARPARYVRLEVTGASNYSGEWVSLRELEIIGNCEDDPVPPGEGGLISIRAQGDCGDERMELRIEGQKVGEWTVGTSFSSYEYEGYSGGQVSVAFVNDAVSDCDRNLTVDYVEVCGQRYQTETVATKTGDCCQGVADKLFTNSDFDFGNLACSSSFYQSEKAREQSFLGKGSWSLRSYPNPATDELTVEGLADYQVTLYTLTGRLVMQRSYPAGRAALDVRNVLPGTYVLKMQSDQGEVSRRIVVE